MKSKTHSASRHVVLLALATALSLAGCGGSSTQTASGPSGGSTVALSSRTAHDLAGHDTVSRSGTIQRPMRGTGGAEINDDNQPESKQSAGKGNSQLDPCALVTKAEVEQAVGVEVNGPQEAPLGPTCIYQPRGASEPVSVDIESIEFAKVRPQIRHLERVKLNGHTAFCGDYGRSTTFVPLSNERVLSISASCRAGVMLAGEALPHVKL